MLPTKGYFQDIECPYYNSFCGRPYCHFRHRKKQSENIELVEETVEIVDKKVVPTYRPTPKSQLEGLQTNKSHIPISYVPDLAFRPERQVRPIVRYEKPTYKPTPLSLLSSNSRNPATTPSNPIGNISGININNEYDPQKAEINFEDLTTEFDLIDEIINEDDKDDDTQIQAAFSEDESDNEVSTQVNKTSSSGKETNLGIEKHEKIIEGQSVNDKIFSSLGKKHNKESDNAKLSSGLTKKQNKTEPRKESRDKSSDKRDKVILNSSDSDIKKDKKSVTKPLEKPREKRTEEKSKSGASVKPSVKSKEKKEKNSDSEHSEKERSSGKDRKHTSSKEKERDRSKEKSYGSKSESKERDRKSETNGKQGSSNSKSKKEKLDNNDKHSKSKNKTKEKPSEKPKAEDSRKEARDKDINKKHKSKERDKSKEKEKDNRNTEKERKKSSKVKVDHKDKREDKLKKHKKNAKDKRDRDKKTKIQIKESSRSKKPSRNSSSSSSSDGDRKNDIFENDLVNTESNNFENDTNFEMSDIDLDDEDETMRECLKIFNEYKPKAITITPERSPELYQDSFDEVIVGKKRTAHDGAEISQMYSKVQPPPKPKSVVAPGEALRNRFKVARLAQKSREEENLMNEIQKYVQNPQQSTKRSAPPSLLEAARQLKIKRVESDRKKQLNLSRAPSSTSNSLVDDILNGRAQPSSSQTANSTAFLPRKKIPAVPNVALMQKAKERISRIVARAPQPIKTIAQTQKTNRVAHVPEFSLSDIPDVLESAKSKLPVNVRTRFLTMIADECVKLYISKDDAYERALSEEFACYEKCKVIATYRNSAMLAVNRLRKELQEREVKGLGMVLAGEQPDGDKSSDFEGRKFYNNVRKWVLNEEELTLHGYPRDSGERGRVVMQSKKEIDYSIDENHRRCCRCHKVYQVDDDGWPLYEEECMYHPSKKRTIRGEHVFLCCKSTDDSGCVTSDTHVSDGLEHEQLEGYQTTLDPETDNDPRSSAVYALDCEMCYTTKGLELTRVTIVDTDCKTVYESLVKPLNPIIDYNTRFSGITAEQMNKTSTNILQVQANILHLCNAKTILVGHSLESDMKALKIVHGTVIDTSVLFPHKMGLPHKRSLKMLASEILKKIIQNDVCGHDSAEDAVTCMELIKWKLKEELKVRMK